VKTPQSAHLNDPFAQRIVAVSKQLVLIVRRELGMTSSAAAQPGVQDNTE
jgi:hypothetical protein